MLRKAIPAAFSIAFGAAAFIAQGAAKADADGGVITGTTGLATPPPMAPVPSLQQPQAQTMVSTSLIVPLETARQSPSIL
jgi:hypothetical protein